LGSGGVKIPSDECVEELKNGRVPGPQISGEIAGEDEDVAVEAGAKGLQEILERGRLVEGSPPVMVMPSAAGRVAPTAKARRTRLGRACSSGGVSA